MLGSNGPLLHGRLSELQKLRVRTEEQNANFADPFISIQGINDSYSVVEAIVQEYMNSHELFPPHQESLMKENDVAKQEEDSIKEAASTAQAVMNFFGINHKKEDRCVDSSEENEFGTSGSKSGDNQEGNEVKIDSSLGNATLPLNFLKCISEELKELSLIQLLDLLISIACMDIESSPQDLSLYICLQLIYERKYYCTQLSEDKERVIKILRTSLDIINQASAVGMFGWIDYGESQALDRTMERPFQSLSDIGNFHALHKDWNSAIEVFQSLVLRCEQHLPLYHPITINAILDLGASCCFDGDHKQAAMCAQKAADRLGIYLKEQKQLCESNTNPMSSKYLSMLIAFVSQMKSYSKRKMMSLLSSNHPMKLLYHCFLADSLSVLAMCQRNDTKLMETSSSGLDNVKDIWRNAADHYKFALKGWVKNYGIHHPNVPSTTCSFARCLHELGLRNDALRVLSSIVNSRHSLTATDFRLLYHKSVAICTWHMAAYTVENRPTEEGRMRAIEILELGAERLQNELSGAEKVDKVYECCLTLVNAFKEERERLNNALEGITEMHPTFFEESKMNSTFVSI